MLGADIGFRIPNVSDGSSVVQVSRILYLEMLHPLTF